MQTGDRVNFVLVKGSQLPSSIDTATVYFLEGAQQLYLGDTLLGDVDNIYTAASWIDATASAGIHNSIYRGEFLGDWLSDAQKAAISNGTFDDMYIGDYWLINNRRWRIAAFDYYMNTGNTTPRVSAHHVTIVPERAFYGSSIPTMYDTNDTSGGYANSNIFTLLNDDNSDTCMEIYQAFGATNLLTHEQLFINAANNGRSTGFAWYSSKIYLMSSINVCGSLVGSVMGDGSALCKHASIDKSQYPLFRLCPEAAFRYLAAAGFWLRDVVSGSDFARMSDKGNLGCSPASNRSAILPVFSIIG